jgi:hypothetical protein
MVADSLNITSLINSKKGIHISVYIPRPTSEIHFKSLVQASLTKCLNQIGASLTNDKTDELLGPIKGLINNPKMISGFNTNIAIFRTTEYLRLVSLPIDTKFSVHVADSFHVKPLLAYINQDYKYLFFGSNGKKGYLYQGSRKSYHLVKEFLLHSEDSFANDEKYKSLKTSAQKKKYLLQTNISWVEETISEIDKDQSYSIFISANTAETKALKNVLKNNQVYWRNVSKKFLPENEKSTMQMIQETLELEKAISLNLSLSEFEKSNATRLAAAYVSYDINEISKAAKRGLVKKLLIASDASVFGKLDEISGEVKVQEADMDHIDDDLLDDIAQNVFKSGGEVLLLKKKLMPSGELIAGTIKNTKNGVLLCSK